MPLCPSVRTDARDRGRHGLVLLHDCVYLINILTGGTRRKLIRKTHSSKFEVIRANAVNREGRCKGRAGNN